MAFYRWLTDHLRQNATGMPEGMRQLLEQGGRFTLPHEVEWEKAARGAQDCRIYPWGDEIDPDKANYEETKIGTTSALGCFSKGRSPFGCEDMAGNVWEWCRNTWQESPHKREDRTKVEKKVGSARVVRGGSWYYPAVLCRCSSRSWSFPDCRAGFLGFRVVLVPSSVARDSERSELLQ